MPRWMDGNQLLRGLLERSEYGSTVQAVAALTLFTHPDTVVQSGGRNLFRIVRRKNQADVGTIHEALDGGLVMRDDNSGPTDAFLWANQLARSGSRDVQFNHLYDRAQGDDDICTVYTSLANMCVTPAFLAKLTDTDAEVQALLRYRVFDLYGYAPASTPPKPARYDSLRWAAFPSAAPNLEERLRAALRRCPKRRTTRSAREIGWLFSDFQPDPTV